MMGHPSQSMYRHQQSVFSAFLTIVMLCVGLCLLIWNEFWIIQTVSFVAETLMQVVKLPSAISLLDNNDGKLVHLSGSLYTDEPFVMNEYGITVSAVKLKHRVQMYQWVEELERAVEDSEHYNFSARYRYFTDWKDKLINSSMFSIRTDHTNPRKFPRKTMIYTSERATVGRFSLSTALKQKINNFVPFTSDERPEQRHIKLHSGLYYHCHDVWQPEVGDIRIQFSYAGMAGEHVTILAKQVGVELQPFALSSGEEIALIHPGKWSVEEMFHGHHRTLWCLWWMLRVLGCLCVFLGTDCATTLLHVIVFRCWNNSCAATLRSFSARLAISICFSLFIISLPWFLYKPILGITLCGVALSLVLHILKRNACEMQKCL